jgi:hypothetical protein
LEQFLLKNSTAQIYLLVVEFWNQRNTCRKADFSRLRTRYIELSSELINILSEGISHNQG